MYYEDNFYNSFVYICVDHHPVTMIFVDLSYNTMNCDGLRWITTAYDPYRLISSMLYVEYSKLR